MKKISLLILTLFCLSLSAHADQLAWISKQEAADAVKFLEKQTVVLLYCGCCDNDPKLYLKIDHVYYHYTGYGDYYEVVIEGVDANGNKTSEPIDLAYTHIQNGKHALCVGLALNMECDPCEEKIPWKSPFASKGN